MKAPASLSEIPHLLALLDDPDDQVALIVHDRLTTMGPPVAGLLRSLSIDAKNRTLTRRLESVLSDIESDQTMHALYAWRNNPDPDLMQGLCLITQLISPITLVDTLFDSLLDISKEVWIELSDQKTVMELVNLLNHILYHRLGFRAEDPFLTDFDKALLHNTVETKIANPVLFGLLYIAVAEHASIPVSAVAFPGGFLPACLNNEGRLLFYINVCQNGEAFGHEQLRTYLHNFGLSISNDRFEPCHAPTLLSIYAESLSYIADSLGDKELEYKMEKVIELLGNKRYLLIEEDDD